MAGFLTSMARNISYMQATNNKLVPTMELVLMCSVPKWQATPGGSIERVEIIEEHRIACDQQRLEKLIDFLEERLKEITAMRESLPMPANSEDIGEPDQK